VSAPALREATKPLPRVPAAPNLTVSRLASPIRDTSNINGFPLGSPAFPLGAPKSRFAARVVTLRPESDPGRALSGCEAANAAAEKTAASVDYVNEAVAWFEASGASPQEVCQALRYLPEDRQPNWETVRHAVRTVAWCGGFI
jgi:hypothetical protein